MLGSFAEGFESWRKVIPCGADLPARLALFKNAAADVAGYVARGLDRAAAADELYSIAQANGLLAQFGADEIQRIIADAFGNAEVVPDLKPFPPDIKDAPYRPNGHGKSARKLAGTFAFRPLDRAVEGDAMGAEWIVENLLPRVGVAILSGHPGVGKTHIVNDMMCSVATGMPFAGHEVRRVCGAVLFAAEGAETAPVRWQVLRHAKTGPYFESIGVAPDTAFPVDYTARVPCLNDSDAFEQYDAAFLEVAELQAARMAAAGVAYDGLGLAIIDTYNAATSLTDDQHNKVGSTQAIFNMLRKLAVKHGCCIMVVDHLGKDASRGPLGSINKTASPDADLRITGTVGEDGSVSHTAMTIHKLRAGPQGERLPFELKTVRMPATESQDGKTVRWDSNSDGMHVKRQNKRHAALMKAVDDAILQKWQWVRVGDNANFKATDSRLVWDSFKLSAAATAEEGEKRDGTLRKAYNRAMKDSSETGLIASKTLEDKRVIIWRTDYKVADSFKVSEGRNE